jgi:peptidoglycan/LPS O-acetylase OafA/YrhL
VVLALWALLLTFAGYNTSNSDTLAGIIAMAWSLMFAITLEKYIHVRREPWRVEKLLIPVGLCSYSLYLLHQPLLAPLLEAIHRWIPRSANHWADLTVTGVLLLVLLTLIAWASFRWIETSGIKMGHRLSSRASADPARMRG